MSCYYSDANSSTYNPKMIKNCQECIIECGDRVSHGTMSRAEEQALKAYPRTDDAWGDEWQKRVGFVEGYNQAEKDLMEKFKMWVAHNGYTAKEAEAVYNDFKQFITEN